MGRGLARAHLGQFEAALEDLSMAVAIGRETDNLMRHADALLAQSEVLSLAGRHDDAAIAFEAGMALLPQKGNVAALHRLSVPETPGRPA